MKWKLLNHVRLCNPTDYTVHGILQARILEWVAFPFSRGSSQPRDRTQVSCSAGRFFTSWATREAPLWNKASSNLLLWQLRQLLLVTELCTVAAAKIFLMFFWGIGAWGWTGRWGSVRSSQPVFERTESLKEGVWRGKARGLWRRLPGMPLPGRRKKHKAGVGGYQGERCHRGQSLAPMSQRRAADRSKASVCRRDHCPQRTNTRSVSAVCQAKKCKYEEVKNTEMESMELVYHLFEVLGNKRRKCEVTHKRHQDHVSWTI